LEPKTKPKKNEPHRLLTLFFFFYLPAKGSGWKWINWPERLSLFEVQRATRHHTASRGIVSKVSPGKETQNSISGKNSKT
jgi:hypothetical protein